MDGVFGNTVGIITDVARRKDQLSGLCGQSSEMIASQGRLYVCSLCVRVDPRSGSCVIFFLIVFVFSFCSVGACSTILQRGLQRACSVIFFSFLFFFFLIDLRYKGLLVFSLSKFASVNSPEKGEGRCQYAVC